MNSKIIFSLITLVLLSGCATKQYPQASYMTIEEGDTLNCQEIRHEIAKNDGVIKQIDATGEFNGRTVLGVFGDLGIGNGLAKSQAYDQANKRAEQLAKINAQKCSNQQKTNLG